MASALSPRPAQPGEWSAAFALLFHKVESEQRRLRITSALQLLRRGELNPEGIFVLPDKDGLAGVLLCLIAPGATALLWPPQAGAEDGREQREDRLLQHALAFLHGRGVKLSQTLLHPDDLAEGQSLLRNGFVYVSHLNYLRHDLNLPPRELGLPGRLDYQTFAEVKRTLFQEVLARTYVDSLDCPEINGLRSMDEVIAGHQAQGRHDPRFWWLASADGRPIGVAITTELPETGDWDLSYLGIVPEARRQGFGREILLHVLVEARAAGVSSLSLCVDGRNEPAWQLYQSIGFQLFDRREVFLALLPDGPIVPGG
jgi:mycothiol synthase